MRELTGHKVNGCNDATTVEVMDEPGHGGACHDYLITIREGRNAGKDWPINFQNGPITEAGVNGVTHE